MKKLRQKLEKRTERAIKNLLKQKSYGSFMGDTGFYCYEIKSERLLIIMIGNLLVWTPKEGFNIKHALSLCSMKIIIRDIKEYLEKNTTEA